MKTIIFAIAFFCAACAFAQTAAQPETQTVYTYSMPSHELTVTNGTEWFCNLSVGMKADKKAKRILVTGLGPNETASTAVKSGKKHSAWKDMIPFATGSVVRYARSSDVDIPVTALFYADPERTQYVGASVSVFRIPGNGMTSVSSLIFRGRNIWFAEGLRKLPVPFASQSSTTIKPLDVSYTAGEGMGIQVFVWNSPTDAQIVVNGVSQGLIHEGNMYYFASRRPAIITLMAKDGTGRLRVWNGAFANQDFFGVHVTLATVLGMRNLH